MKVRNFYGPTSRAVLEQIRIELGADAMIVANHPTAQGVEISALPGGAVDALLESAPRSTRRSRASEAASHEVAQSARQAEEAAPTEPAPRIDDASLGARVIN